MTRNCLDCVTSPPGYAEITAWDHIFDQLSDQAYRTDVWAAAYLINGGASDVGFYYFRCWLVFLTC